MMSARSRTSRQRQADRLRGFAYFESFDEVFRWTKDDVDALQRSNVPLLPRSNSHSTEGGTKSSVMLIHDYRGNYQTYESCQGVAVSDEVQYTCEYLQYVETFVYFSHKLVTVPPPTWTNTCHRNGVKVLGTFIVEPGSKSVQDILEMDNGSFWLASRLANMAKWYGFDGWLINIETSFPLLSWNCDKLVGFLEQLRAGLGSEGRVVWYDGLTVLNIVWYQNSLNALNLRFARAAGSILTNYAWTPDLAAASKSNAELNGLDLENVYIGIDVWAQNEQHGCNKRVTYPIKCGGGTGTGMGMKVLSELGLSTGIFAPAWSFEHFPGHGRQVEEAMWKGFPLSYEVECSCKDRLQHTALPYESNPITGYAARYPAGTETFFHTNYKTAFCSETTSGLVKAHLGQMSPLPISSSSPLRSARANDPPVRGSFSCSVVEASAKCTFGVSLDSPPTTASRPDHNLIEVTGHLVLHELTLKGNVDFELEAKYSKPQLSDALVNLTVQSATESHYLGLPNKAVDRGTEKSKFSFKHEKTDVTLGVEIKFHVSPNATSQQQQQSFKIIDLFSLMIRPLQKAHDRQHQICDARLEQRGEGDFRHSRLLWNISSSPESDGDGNGLPFSNITGPFAYFVISENGRVLGSAYALEYVLEGIDGDQRAWAEIRQGTEFCIKGYGFDGASLAEDKVTFQGHRVNEQKDDWVLV